MRTRALRALAAAALASAYAVGVLAGDDGEATADVVELSENEVRRILQHAPLGDPPPDPTNAVADDPRAALLGQALFFDPRVSADGEVSCATCHDPARGFTDGRVVALGLGHGPRNTPTLLNVAWQRWLFWDGRSDTLWAQALQPVENRVEMGSTRLTWLRTVAGDPAQRALYEEVFGPLPDVGDARFPERARPVPGDPDHPDRLAWDALEPADRDAIDRAYANLGKAIAAYERRLASRRSAFDVFAEGLREGDAAKLAALTPSEQRGLKLFVGRAGCRVCHSGPTFSDGEFHDLRLPARDGQVPVDSGRHGGAAAVAADPFNAAGAHSDDPDGPTAVRARTIARTPELWGQFKTPTLRNVAITAPYMHAGQFETLGEILHFYDTLEGAQVFGHHQEQVLQPLRLDPGDLEDLEAFLRALTDDSLAPDLLAPPVLPPGPR